MKNTDPTASQNQAWGFYGTLRTIHNFSEDATARLFDAACRQTAETFGMKLDAARRFLDGSHGRHLADNIENLGIGGFRADLAKQLAIRPSGTAKARKFASETTDAEFYGSF